MKAVRTILLLLAAIGFIGAGINHFRSEAFYVRIIPPQFPKPRLLVWISGVAEIVGGVGLLIPKTRRAAGWGLIALLIAVFPANLYMAIDPVGSGSQNFPRWALWVRLPLQLVMIGGFWFLANVGCTGWRLKSQPRTMECE